MNRVTLLMGKTLSLIFLLLVLSACVKDIHSRPTAVGSELSPDRVMSGPRIAGETNLRALLDARDPVLAGETSAPPPRPASAKPAEPVSLSLQEAVLTGLAQNENFRVERLQPALSRSAEEVERAAFDPLLSAAVSHGHGQSGMSGASQITTNSTTDTNTVASTLGGADAESLQATLGLRQTTAIGTTVELNADQERLSRDDPETERTVRSWDLTLTQALLQGRGADVTLARLRQSRLDTEISLYELQGAAEALVTQIEKGYWDLILAERSLAIYQQSLAIARDQVEEVHVRIEVGALAENEAAAAEAEEASRAQELVTAQGAVAKARLNLLRFVNLNGQADWQAALKLTEEPELGEMKVDTVENHVALAFRKRADLNQARLLVRRRDLEVVRTKNGLLPKLDLFISLGGSRFTDSFAGQERQVDNQTAYAGGLTLELPLGNRQAKALHAAAGWSLDQASAALANMEQLVQVDVRSAYVDVEQAAAQVKAAETTLLLREKTLALEQEKFRVGRSTTLLVAQAQRDLLASRISLAEAVVGVRKAFLDLHRLDGSLLAHRGIGS